jgi:transposase-like protein
LDLKFIQGEKVREVARKLSVSEADLYRKQRIALESVAQNLMKMEAEATSTEVKPTPETQTDQDQ